MTDSSKLYKCFAVLSCINLLGIGGLGYYQIQQHQILKSNADEFKAVDLKLDGVQEQQRVFQQHFQVIQQQLHEKATHIVILQQVLWLIRQAKWQLKIMHHAYTAQQFLTYALKIAKANHWLTLEEALENDIHELTNQGLIHDNQLIEKIQSLHLILEKLQKKASLHQTVALESTEPLSSSNAKIQNFLQQLKPFLSIERFHQPLPKILTPNEQYHVLNQMLMILNEMQLTGLNRDIVSYKTLTGDLMTRWHLLSPQIQEVEIETIIQELQDVHLVLEKPMYFSSFAEVHHLIDMAGKNQ